MDYPLGHVLIKLSCDVHTDDAGEPIADTTSPPKLSVEIDLPVTDQQRQAAKYMRKCADQLDPPRRPLTVDEAMQRLDAATDAYRDALANEQRR